ncbi:MAG: amino acid ABC transporter ATP-binding protein [Clostridia bacterium]|nr:amino acid ABC transporter ATP-binding protein [Clostridia bacterium]
MAFLEVQNLIKSFGKTEVLKGVSFTLEEGEVLSIIGPSGNGKTTLLRCLNYLEFVDGGIVKLNDTVIQDENVKTLKEDEIRNQRLHFGMVFQSFNLFPQYTAKQNVSLALSIMEKERAKKGQEPLYSVPSEKVAENLLERVGLKDKMNNYPCELSGGQCQRVAIARAMALKPDVLCFDEPTSALDPELTGEVLKVIKELKATTGMTMIIVTHEMEFAKNISDKVMFMWDGKVCEFGTPEKVLENPEMEETKHFLQSFLENKQ